MLNPSPGEKQQNHSPRGMGVLWVVGFLFIHLFIIFYCQYPPCETFFPALTFLHASYLPRASLSCSTGTKTTLTSSDLLETPWPSILNPTSTRSLLYETGPLKASWSVTFPPQFPNANRQDT